MLFRVSLDAPILRVGLVIADLPGKSAGHSNLSPVNSHLGLQDTNLARVKAAQEYLTKCDHIFLVANISRALTDQSLKTSLDTAISHSAPSSGEVSRGKASRIAVICTKSEVGIL